MRQKILLRMYLKQACFNGVLLKACLCERKENLDTIVGTSCVHCECSFHSNR